MAADGPRPSHVLLLLLMARVFLFLILGLCGFFAGDEAHDERQDDRAKDRDNDRVDHSSACGHAKARHDKTADQCPDNADYNIHDEAVAGAAHDFAGSPPSNKTHDDPPKYRHGWPP